ncbi:MAG: hypothetical protein GC146_06475 [Limimaricola sp.]|uniref:hypothetical protein n=1 Tax=Limimaricola sp. TaxID=2211665 RepID=UPI001D29C3C4|nr:hypothetical protein [Limimaricola sp.]MBI1416853.1 hypothetical protein [Limimaricola sp.]
MTHLRPVPTPKPRISAKLRAAMDYRVRGATITEACEKASLSPAGWHKAMKRPAVRDAYEAAQARFIAEAEGLRAVAKVRALEVALDLMLNAKSESIRARMAEFLAADAKVSPVAVHVDARQIAGAYEYRRPGERVVEIQQAPHEET